MKQKKIAIIYIGYPRFKEIGYKNHKKMINIFLKYKIY